MKNKKGVLFMVDVLIGFTIIVVGFLMLTNYYYDIPLATQSEFYAEDFLRFLTTTEYSEFSSGPVRSWISAGNVSESESLGSSLARFCYSNDELMLESVINESLGEIIPVQLSYVANMYDLNDDDIPLINCSVSKIVNPDADISRVSVSRSLVISQDNNYDFIGPYILEVQVW